MKKFLLAAAWMFSSLALADGHVHDDGYTGRMAEAHASDTAQPSPAAQRAPDAAVSGSEVEYGSVGGKPARGYLAFPVDSHGGLPGLIVFHEWWGLNDNIAGMTRQLAAQGYAALAVDLYGGSASTPEQAQKLMKQALAEPKRLGEHMRAAMGYLRGTLNAPKVGTIGWCFGGGMSLQAALAMPDQVNAAVMYYGRPETDRAELANLKMPLLGLFGEADQGIPVSEVRQFEGTLAELHLPAEIHIYPGVGHAFANPSGKNYQRAAAEDAWARVVAFLHKHL
ncbi:MAG TPA: dienelactone hydrolase family protein [Solimonas sp.]|nr:dienelactone hydrolase family protein [Solimonas sp.]